LIQLSVIRPIQISALACLAASAILFATPLFWPEFPIGPLILANWLAFMISSYFIFKGTRGGNEIKQQTLNLWRALLISFAIGGLFAVMIAERIV
tara:strand:- start:192 stop:476 length:285 start_codon:yes stop_codon:yes gene_type:complete